jgi:hypothetical protein
MTRRDFVHAVTDGLQRFLRAVGNTRVVNPDQWDGRRRDGIAFFHVDNHFDTYLNAPFFRDEVCQPPPSIAPAGGLAQRECENRAEPMFQRRGAEVLCDARRITAFARLDCYAMARQELRRHDERAKPHIGGACLNGCLQKIEAL